MGWSYYADADAPNVGVLQRKGLWLPSELHCPYLAVSVHGSGGTADSQSRHNAGSDPNHRDSVAQEFYLYFDRLARNGVAIVSHDFAGVIGGAMEPNNFGDNDTMALMDYQRVVTAPSLGLSSNRIIVLGSSQGAHDAECYAFLWPERVAAMMLTNAGSDLEYSRAGDFNASINAAWGAAAGTIFSLAYVPPSGPMVPLVGKNPGGVATDWTNNTSYVVGSLVVGPINQYGSGYWRSLTVHTSALTGAFPGEGSLWTAVDPMTLHYTVPSEGGTSLAWPAGGVHILGGHSIDVTVPAALVGKAANFLEPANITRWKSILDGSLVGPNAAGVLLPGVTSNGFTTPDSAALSFPGDIDVRAKMSLPSWSAPAAGGVILAKSGAAGHRSWYFSVTSTGKLQLQVSTDGTTLVGSASSAVFTAPDGATQWVRATWVQSTGQIVYYTSPDGVTWTLISTRTASVASIFDSDSVVSLGENATGSSPLTGTIYYAEVRSGINGTVLASFDPTRATILGTRSPSTLTDAQGNAWTAQGTNWDWATAVVPGYQPLPNFIPYSRGDYVVMASGTNGTPHSGEWWYQQVGMRTLVIPPDSKGMSFNHAGNTQPRDELYEQTYSLTAQDTTGASTPVVPLGNNGVCLFTLSGTWSGTVTFERQDAAGVWATYGVYNSVEMIAQPSESSGTTSTTKTANGVYRMVTGAAQGNLAARVRFSTRVSGTVNVKAGPIYPGNASWRGSHPEVASAIALSLVPDFAPPARQWLKGGSSEPSGRLVLSAGGAATGTRTVLSGGTA